MSENPDKAFVSAGVGKIDGGEELGESKPFYIEFRAFLHRAYEAEHGALPLWAVYATSKMAVADIYSRMHPVYGSTSISLCTPDVPVALMRTATLIHVHNVIGLPGKISNAPPLFDDQTSSYHAVYDPRAL